MSIDVVANPTMQQMTAYLDQLARRQTIVATNIANIDTPGYKARDIDFAAAKETAAAIEAQGGQALPLCTDVADEASTLEMARQTMERFGRIDILVNNAAVYAELERKPWREISLAEWERVMAVNVRGCFLCARAVLPPMIELGKGKIINITSVNVWTAPPPVCVSRSVSVMGLWLAS